MRHDGFSFTITDLGRLLGKSPVTLRKWEAQGWVDYPRAESGVRTFTPDDVVAIASRAYGNGRIKHARAVLIIAAMNALGDIEKENT